MSHVAGAACTIRSTWEGASARPFRFGPLGGLEAVAGFVEIKPYSTAHEQALETTEAILRTVLADNGRAVSGCATCQANQSLRRTS